MYYAAFEEMLAVDRRQELLREAAQQRLLRQARGAAVEGAPRRGGLRRDLVVVIAWIGSQVMHWGGRLQGASDSTLAAPVPVAAEC